MVYTTRAIVLKTIKHGDSTTILKAFTELHGLRSYAVRTGVKSKLSRAALQPLNRVELVVRERADKDLHPVSELRVTKPYRQLPFDPVRGTLALFVQEVLYKLLRGEAADEELFNFLDDALEVMDSAPDIRNFPLVFLVQLSGQMGFQPAFPALGEDHFDLKEGEFVRGLVPHGHTLAPPLSTHLVALLAVRITELPGPAINAAHRRALLDHLLLYFRLHVEGLHELRSPAVLHQVLG